MIEGGTKGVREVKIFKVLTFYLLISLMMVEELDALHCNGETDEEGKKFFACRVRISIFDPYSCRGKLEIVTMDEKELALAMKFENNEEITTGLVFNKASTPNELEFFCLAGDCEEKLNELSVKEMVNKQNSHLMLLLSGEYVDGVVHLLISYQCLLLGN
ncbi:hypothetical protein Y032_0455g1755 [Ancylostoma ceylanicum]|uniref:Transthyretin-like family protein n=1 Tax=Ancylostoma ceylanicum TaxID=53326 RepID=A0A016X052_9BILA|nr:hypothetical protein Y032_0455g1755 [Ancylostoma ceylanicum]